MKKITINTTTKRLAQRNGKWQVETGRVLRSTTSDCDTNVANNRLLKFTDFMQIKEMDRRDTGPWRRLPTTRSTIDITEDDVVTSPRSQFTKPKSTTTKAQDCSVAWKQTADLFQPENCVITDRNKMNYQRTKENKWNGKQSKQKNRNH